MNTRYLISEKRRVKPDAVTAALQTISRDRFRGQLRIEHDEGDPGWAITAPGRTESSWALWQTTARRFEWQLAFGGFWCQWAQALTIETLAFWLTLTVDNGDGERHHSHPSHITKVRTYRQWFETTYRHLFNRDRKIFDTMWRDYLRHVPPDWMAEVTGEAAEA